MWFTSRALRTLPANENGRPEAAVRCSDEIALDYSGIT
jgi:hypothetical protein